jgi:transcriptional regulator with XRE-family HTH domain
VQRKRPNRKSLGTALRQLRLAEGWTQEKLSMKSGLRTATISETENGRHNLSFENIEKWLAALGTSWTEFGERLDRAH